MTMARNKKKNTKKIGNGLTSILSGSFLTKEKLSDLFAFFVYVAILLMVLISNTYLAEQRTREITQDARLLNDLQVKHLQLRSEIMQNSKQSVLAKRLAPTGIKETSDPLKRITTEKQ